MLAEDVSGQHSGDRALTRVVADVGALGALSAVGVYAVLQIAYARFYDPFGLTPGDLGLGYVELLAQSAIGAVALLGLIAAIVSLLVALVVGAVALEHWDEFASKARLRGHRAVVRCVCARVGRRNAVVDRRRRRGLGARNDGADGRDRRGRRGR